MVEPTLLVFDLVLILSISTWDSFGVGFLGKTLALEV